MTKYSLLLQALPSTLILPLPLAPSKEAASPASFSLTDPRYLLASVTAVNDDLAYITLPIPTASPCSFITIFGFYYQYLHW